MASPPAPPLRPLEAPRSLAEDAADRIREQILAGGYGQGEHLVEAKIADQLAISRGPVREAFKLLRSEGLLKEEPRRGTFVVSLTPDDVREVYGLRAALEGRAGRLLARGGDPGVIATLGALTDEIDAAVRARDATAVSRADLAFHEAICRLCGNSRIHDAFVRSVPTIRALLRLDERVLHSLDEISLQHRPFVEAIAARDEELAGRLLAEHAETAGELIAGLLSTNDANDANDEAPSHDEAPRES